MKSFLCAELGNAFAVYEFGQEMTQKVDNSCEILL